MKIHVTWLIASSVAFAGLGAAWAAGKDIVALGPEDMKWVEVPQAPGARVANVVGDIFKGPHSAFVTLPPGDAHPMHIHPNEVRAVVISGTFTVTPENGVEKKLGPGSYFSIPGGLKHASSCAPGLPCVLFQEGPGKFDMKPVGDKHAGGDKGPGHKGPGEKPSAKQ